MGEKDPSTEGQFLCTVHERVEQILLRRKISLSKVAISSWIFELCVQGSQK